MSLINVKVDPSQEKKNRLSSRWKTDFNLKTIKIILNPCHKGDLPVNKDLNAKAKIPKSIDENTEE